MADDLNNSLPPEYLAEIDAANKKRMIAQLLQKQALGFQGAPTGGKVAAKTSPLAWMANAASGYLGASADSAGAGAVRNVQNRALADQKAEGAALLAAPEDQQLAQAQAGKFPQTQALGKLLYDRKVKQMEGFSGAVKGVDPAAAANTFLTGKLPTGPYTPPAIPGEESKLDAQGNPYLRTTNQRGEVGVHYAPKDRNITVDNTGESAAAKAVGAKIPERYAEVTGAAKAAVAEMEGAKRIKALLADPATITGFGANPASWLANLGAKLNLTGPDAAIKTQALFSELASQTLNNVKRLPGAITEKERPFLADAAAGRIEWTPQALQRLADISEMSGHNQLTELLTEYQSLGTLPQANSSGAPQAWPFPKGWNFTADPKKYTEIGPNRYRYNEEASSPAKPAAVAVNPASLPPPKNGRAYSLEEVRQLFPNAKLP